MLGVAWLLLFVLLIATLQGSRSSRFELSADGLRIRGDLYGRLIPIPQLRGGSARQIDLAAERELRPTVRTFGTAVGGYASGWFRLASGEKALLYVTDRRRVVYIPTTEGYSLLLSVQEPELFVSRLREIAPAT
ncbi:MAG TPA: PH domain-containing protein [Gemmatimonadaceae bacterium]|nr:PH domain-containing protein [Gemmatimonadaceae bacterium]